MLVDVLRPYICTLYPFSIVRGHVLLFSLGPYEPRHEKTCFCIYAKNNGQISCAITAQTISAFVFGT